MTEIARGIEAPAMVSWPHRAPLETGKPTAARGIEAPATASWPHRAPLESGKPRARTLSAHHTCIILYCVCSQ
eukprot:12014625-Karenia_brevis.AAC.1